jgi:hypothetical protein
MQKKAAPGIMGVGIDMIDSIGIEGTRSSNESINFIAFVEKQFCEIRTILPCDPCDECFFHGSPC